MNAVEIEEAVSELAAAPFDPAEFPFAFLTAFGNKATTVNRLRTPSLNKSDVAGGVLQARNIHLAVCAEGLVRETMAALRASPKTAANKVKFLLATDGVTLEAEDLVSDEPPVVCNYPDFAEHFGFFLPLAGHLDRAGADASEEMVVDAVNDTLKAIAASLLMEQVLAPRFDFTPKNSGEREGFNYGEGGYDPKGTNVGFNEATGQFHLEINGLVTPQSNEAKRTCQEDLNEVITAFVQDKSALERGLFDEETAPEELTQVRMGKIVKDRYPELSETDQEAVRQHAIAALNLTQQAKAIATEMEEKGETKGGSAFVDSVRKYVMSVRDLDIDLIDKINPFGAAYSILAKSMDPAVFKQVAAVIAAKRINLTLDEARDLAKRALKFKQERGRLPDITSPDAWEKRMAEGVAFLQRHATAAANG